MLSHALTLFRGMPTVGGAGGAGEARVELGQVGYGPMGVAASGGREPDMDVTLSMTKPAMGVNGEGQAAAPLAVAGGGTPVSVAAVATADGAAGPDRAAGLAEIEAAFDRCGAAIHRGLMVRTGRDAATCDDLMQQLWLAAQRNAVGVRVGELERWMRGVARNLLVTHHRRERARPGSAADRRGARVDAALAAEVGLMLERGPLPAEALERGELVEQLLLALTDLDAEDQELLLAHYAEGVAQAALAARAGCGVRAIEGRLYRARAALRQRLAQAPDDGA